MPDARDGPILALVSSHRLDIIKLLPALVIDEGDVDHLIASLRTTIGACHQFPGPVWEIARRLGSHALRSRRPIPA